MELNEKLAKKAQEIKKQEDEEIKQIKLKSGRELQQKIKEKEE
jgi:hypothetical protein